MSAPLSQQELELDLKELPGWKFEDDRLMRELVFSSFRQAMAFLTRLAFEAEEQNHHPEIYLVYNRVMVALTTHDAGDRVTSNDVRLAHKVELVLKEFQSQRN